MELLYSRWKHLPWKFIKSPWEQWNELPTFLIIEYVIFFLTTITFWHALHQPGRRHLVVWICSFLTGSANDIFFMALPLVDNFWQAQATIMLTPRLPLYICCVYNIFLYCSTILSWRYRLPRLAQSVLTGIIAWSIYAPYDIDGAKFLWWTWHDTDPPIKARFLGAPLGSSLWIVTFSTTFTYLIDYFQESKKWNPLVTILLSCLLTTPIMLMEMALLQLLARDHQGVVSFNTVSVCLLLFFALFFFSLLLSSRKTTSTKQQQKQRFHIKYSPNIDIVLMLAITFYFICLNAIMFYGEPQQHVSRGIHQTFGPCQVKMSDFSGLTRDKYVCLRDQDEEDWDFHCSTPPTRNETTSDLTEWYTICGTKHKQWDLLMRGIVLISTLGLLFLIGAALRSAGGKNKKIKRRKQE